MVRQRSHLGSLHLPQNCVSQSLHIISLHVSHMCTVSDSRSQERLHAA